MQPDDVCSNASALIDANAGSRAGVSTAPRIGGHGRAAPDGGRLASAPNPARRSKSPKMARRPLDGGGQGSAIGRSRVSNRSRWCTFPGSRKSSRMMWRRRWSGPPGKAPPHKPGPRRTRDNAGPGRVERRSRHGARPPRAAPNQGSRRPGRAVARDQRITPVRPFGSARRITLAPWDAIRRDDEI